MVLAFRRTVPLQDRSQDRQGRRITRSRCRSRIIRRARSTSKLDQDGDIWVGLMYQTGTGAVRPQDRDLPHLPDPQGMAARRHAAVALLGGRIEGRRQSLGEELRPLAGHAARHRHRRSTRTSARSAIPANDRPIGIYGIYADQQNNAYILEFPAGGIGKIDAKTGKLAFYPTPTPYARARRGRVDAQNRLWFAEFGGNAIGMFDPETENDHRVDRIRSSGRRPTTSWPTATAKSGRSTKPPTASAGSIRARRDHQLSAAALRELPPRVRRRPYRPDDGLDRQQSRRVGGADRAAGLTTPARPLVTPI